MHFDENTFENLDGLKASEYVLSLANEGCFDGDMRVFNYIVSALPKMDLPHLEVAIFILAKVKTEASLRIAANYFNHPDFSIRFVAIKVGKEFPTADEAVMRMVIETLKARGGDGLADELAVLLQRPADARARQVAQEFLIQRGQNREITPKADGN